MRIASGKSESFAVCFVPLILHNPAGDLPQGRVVRERVRLLDLMPTLLDYAGIPIPDDLAGISHLPLVRGAGEQEPLPEHFIVETEFKTAQKIGVYSPEWKYFENRDGHPGTNRHALQRVGTVEDGRETDASEEQPEITRKLRKVLQNWERDNPKAPPLLEGVDLSPLEIEQLRSLGYID